MAPTWAGPSLFNCTLIFMQKIQPKKSVFTNYLLANLTGYLITLAIDKQVLWERAGAFFRVTTLVSARKSHSSGVRGLVLRCLLFNPEGSCSNP